MKDRLFDCMKKTMDRCQGSTEVMAMGGYEHESLRKGIDVLCKDVHGRWSLIYENNKQGRMYNFWKGGSNPHRGVRLRYFT